MIIRGPGSSAARVTSPNRSIYQSKSSLDKAISKAQMERSHPSSITHSDSPTQSALLPEAGRTRVVRSWFQYMIILSSLPYGLTAPLRIFQEGGEQWIPSERSRGHLASLKLMFCLMAQPSHNSWLSGSAVVQVLGAHVPALNSPGCSSDHLLSPTTSDHLLADKYPQIFP